MGSLAEHHYTLYCFYKVWDCSSTIWKYGWSFFLGWILTRCNAIWKILDVDMKIYELGAFLLSFIIVPTSYFRLKKILYYKLFYKTPDRDWAWECNWEMTFYCFLAWDYLSKIMVIGFLKVQVELGWDLKQNKHKHNKFTMQFNQNGTIIMNTW